MCCKLPSVRALAKPPQKWCSHCAASRGCTIYETRPQECRDFYCGWMIDATIPQHWAPKLARMVMILKEKQIMVLVDNDRADIWQKAPYVDDLRSWARHAAAGGRVLLLRAGRDTWALLPQGPRNLGPVREDQLAMSVSRMTPQGMRYDVAIVDPAAPKATG
jgi:uncharacterized protein